MGADQIWVKCLHCHMTVALGEILSLQVPGSYLQKV